MPMSQNEAHALFILTHRPALGDSICLLPTLRALARRAGGRVVVWARNSFLRELCQNLSWADIHIFPPWRWRIPYWLSPGQQAWTRRMRGQSFAEIWLWDDGKPKRQAKYAALAARALGFRPGAEDSGFRYIRHPEGNRHVICRGLSAIGAPDPCGPDAGTGPCAVHGCHHLSTGRATSMSSAWPELLVSEEEAALAKARLTALGWSGEPLATLHPGVTYTQRYGERTPEEHL